MTIAFGPKDALVTPLLGGGMALDAAPYSTGVKIKQATVMLTFLPIRQVIKNVRALLDPSKTISLTSGSGSSPFDTLVGTVISATHPYLDYINIGHYNLEATLEELQLFSVPLNKV